MPEEYWQTSMGYTCFDCHRIFLIGWRHMLTRRNYCPTCGEEHQDRNNLEELIY